MLENMISLNVVSKAFCALLMGVAFAQADETKLLLDFGKEHSEVKMGITDDGVMGGLSKGQMKKTEEGTLKFWGDLSLKNNGGFSSFRMDVGQWDLSGWKGFEVKVKGDGRIYNLRMTTNERFRRSPISFQAKMPTVKGEWKTVRIAFSDLKAGWRGMDLKTKFDPAKIEGAGIILADKKPGSFEMEVKSISAWK